jgi:hypothetical protein
MPYQLYPIPLGVGVDTKSDPFQLPANKLYDLQNGIFTKTGRVDKRWGTKKLGQGIVGSTSTISSAFALNAFEEEMLLFDNTYAYSYSQSTDQWLNRGTARSVIVSGEGIVANNNQQLSPDFASLNGIEVYAWEDTRGSLRYSVLDATVGNIILNDSILYTNCPSANVRPKTLPFGNQIVILFVNASGQLLFTTVNPSNPSQVPTYVNILLNGLSDPAYYDAAVIAGSLYIAFYTSTTVQLVQVNSSMQIAQQVQVSTIGASPIGCINVGSDLSNNVYVSFSDANNNDQAKTAIYTSSLSSLVAATTTISQSTGVLTAIVSINGNIYAEAMGNVVGGVYNNVIYQNTISTSGTVGTTSVFKRALGLASKPFYYNNTILLNVVFQSALQPTYFTLDQYGNTIAKMLPSLSGGVIQNSDYILPECQSISAGIFKFANLEYGVPISELGTVFGLLGVHSTKLDFFDSNQFLSATFNNSLYTVGGILLQYDGSKFFECGFHQYPEGASVSTSGTGGNLGTGTYDWIITYESADNNADTAISTPSISISTAFNSGTTNQATITAPMLRLTGKTNVKVVFYRTIANGTLFYRDSSALLPKYNDPTQDSITFTSTQSDASLQSNALLYTQPDVVGAPTTLENVAPPSVRLITSYASRLFVVSNEMPNRIQYTQQIIPNTPAQFCAELTIDIDPRVGVITALGVLGQCLIIFCQNGIFYLQGQGPDANGQNSDFGDPTQIPSDVGCYNQNSIASIPQGMFFQAPNGGIYLLDQGHNVSLKGAPAIGFWGSSFVPVKSATVVPPQWVIFQTTSTDIAIVYDYFYDTWKKFTNHTAIDSDIYLGNNNLFVFANPNGSVHIQQTSTYNDNGAFYPLSLTTAWITPSVINGYMRVCKAYLLGSYFSTHNLSCAIGFDYETSFKDYESVIVDTALGTGPTTNYGTATTYGADPYFGGGYYGDSVYNFCFDIDTKCTAVRFQFSDNEQSPGQAMSLSVLTLEIQLKDKGNRLPSRKRFSRL